MNWKFISYSFIMLIRMSEHFYLRQCYSILGFICLFQNVSTFNKRHGPRKDNTGIRAVKSAEYLEDLSPATDKFPTPGNWKPTMEHGKIYYGLLCRDYEIAAGEIQVPPEASVQWFDDQMLLPEKAGDIFPGVDSITPNARPSFKQFELGGKVEFYLNEVRKKGPVGRRSKEELGPVVKGTHWGSGLILRDEDRILIRNELQEVFNRPDKELSPTVLALLLRSFWPSRTYVRLFQFGMNKGSRLSDFHKKRIAATCGEKLLAISIELHFQILHLD